MDIVDKIKKYVFKRQTYSIKEGYKRTVFHTKPPRPSFRTDLSDSKYGKDPLYWVPTRRRHADIDEFWSRTEKLKANIIAELQRERDIPNRKPAQPDTPPAVIFPAPLLPIPFPPPLHSAPPPLYFTFPPVHQPPPRVFLPFVPMPTIKIEDASDSDNSFLCNIFSNKS